MYIPSEYKQCSIALTGCKASGLAYDCCEYDLIIIEDCKEGIIKIDDKYIEIHKLSPNKIIMTLQLYGSLILQDPSLKLGALIYSMDNSLLKAHAKDMLVDALLDASNAINSKELEASFLLKRAAYLYLNAVLELNGIKPSPLHIMTQLRELDMDLSLALDCLSVERANKVSIARSINILNKLFNSAIINKKISYLYENSKYTDCNLYLTYIAITLANNNYKKMLDHLNILMDLSSDQQSIKRLAKNIFNECKYLISKL